MRGFTEKYSQGSNNQEIIIPAVSTVQTKESQNPIRGIFRILDAIVKIAFITARIIASLDIIIIIIIFCHHRYYHYHCQ